MPPPRMHYPRSLLQAAEELDGRDQLENGLADLRWPGLLEQATSGLRRATEAIWKPLPIVVSERPDARVIAERQQAQASQPPPAAMPTTPAPPAMPGPDVSPDSGTPIRSAGEMSADLGRSGASRIAAAGTRASRFAGEIARVSREEGVPEDVLAAILDTEDSGETSVSPAGARGLMQVVPGQGFDLPGEDAADPLTSIRQGARALKEKYRMAGGDWALAGRLYFGVGVDAGGVDTDTYGTRFDANRARYGIGQQRQVENAQTTAGIGRQQPVDRGELYPRQDLLDDPDKWAVCGPLGVMAFGAMTGNPVSYERAKQVARDAGWTPERGMAGPQSQVAALRAIGVQTKTGPIDLETIAREVRNGNPVGLSSPGESGHYFTVQGIDEQGRLDLGNSALSLRASGGAKRFWTLDELRDLGAIGNVTTAIYMDNPASPTPSVAASPNAGAGDGPAPAAPPAPAAARTPPSASPAGASPEMLTVRHKRTGMTSRVTPDQFASMTNRDEFEVVGDPRQSMSALDEARASTGGGETMGKVALGEPQDRPADVGGFWPGNGINIPGTSERDPQGYTDPFGLMQPQYPAPYDAALDQSGTLYRQPLSQRPAEVEPSDQGYDPRNADQGAHESAPLRETSTFSTSNEEPRSAIPGPDLGPGGFPIVDQPATYGPYMAETSEPPPAPAPTSPFKPLYDTGGQIVGYVQGAAEAVGNAARGVADAAYEGLAPLREAAAELDGPAGYGQVQANAGEPDYVSQGGSVIRALQTPIKPPPRPEPQYGPFDLSGPEFPDQESRNRFRRTQPGPEDDARAIPYQAAEAARRTLMDAAESFANAIRRGEEGNTLAAAGNALWAALQVVPDVAAFNAASKLVDQMVPEANILGVGPGIMVGMNDLVRLGAAGVNGLKRGVDALQPEGLAAADDAVRGAGAAVGRAARALGEEGRVAAADAPGAQMLGSGVVPSGARGRNATRPQQANALPELPPEATRSVEDAVIAIRNRRTPEQQQLLEASLASAEEKLDRQAVIKAEMPGATTAQIKARIKAEGATLTKTEEAARIGFTGQEEVAEALREGQVVPARAVAGMLGQFPNYLNGVVDFIMEQRQKLVTGTLSEREVAKALIHTVGSMQSGAMSVEKLRPTFGQRIRNLFIDDGKVRPEEAVAAWFLTARGKRALDSLATGKVTQRVWEDLLTLRDAYGNNTLRNMGVFVPMNRTTKQMDWTVEVPRYRTGPKKGQPMQYDLRNLNELTAAINATRGDPEALQAVVAQIKGIGPAKPGFVKHLLGFGKEATFDAVEMSLWLTGKGDTGKLRGPASDLARAAKLYSDDPEVTRLLFDQIRGRFDELRRMGVGADLNEDVYNHILHHWIWDKAKGLQTTHAGMYEAMRNAANADIRPSLSLRADAFNAAQGAVMGGASESLQAGQEGREADPAEMARRGAMGAALGFGAGRFGRGAGRQVGSGMVPRRPTVEVIAERLDAAKAAVRAARASGDLAAERAASDEMWALTDQLVDAQNARRAVEPAIESDIGRRLETLPLAEESADDLAGIGRERVRPEDASNLGGPASVPVRPISLGSGFVPDEGPRIPAERARDVSPGFGEGHVNPSEIREPTLPGMEAPYVKPNLPDVSDARNVGSRPGMNIGARTELLPGFDRIDPLTDPARMPPLENRSIATGQKIEDALPGIIRGLDEPPPKVRADANGPAEMRATGSAGLPTLTDSPRIWERVADAVSPWANRVNIIRYASMLSDTATQIPNILGSVGLAGVDIATTPIAAGIDMARVGAARAVGGPAGRRLGTERQVFMSELPARLRGMRAGASIGLRAAQDVLRTGMREADASKLDKATQGFGTDIPGLAPAGSRAAAATDFAFEAPLRALAAADAVFRTTAAGGHLMAEATAAATRKNGGLTPSPEQIREAAKDPKLLERVKYLAARSVLQEDRTLTDWYKAAMRWRPRNGAGQAAMATAQAAASVEIPYVKTPYNVVAQGMGMSPLGLAGLIQDVAEGKAAREMEYRLARVALGTALMVGAASAYGSGGLTGPRPTDPAEASTLPPGWQPWSRKHTIAGQTFYTPLSIEGPMAVPAVLAILAGEAKKQGKNALSPAWAGQIALGLGRYAEQATFFEGVANISKMFDERTGERNVARNVEQIAAQFSPHVIGGGALGREIQRVMGQPVRDPEGAIEAILATHPATAGRVEPRQDVLGRPVRPADPGPATAVIRASKERDAGVIRAFRQAKEGLPLAAPKSIRHPDEDRLVTLTPKQQHRWRSAFGAALNEGWANEGTPTDAETLRKIEAEARSVANDTVLGRR